MLIVGISEQKNGSTVKCSKQNMANFDSMGLIYYVTIIKTKNWINIVLTVYFTLQITSCKFTQNSI